jgi:hypothetical protein
MDQCGTDKLRVVQLSPKEVFSKLGMHRVSHLTWNLSRQQAASVAAASERTVGI